MMNVWLALAIGVALGLALGWLSAAAKMGQRFSALQIESEGRGKSAESTVIELRGQREELKKSLEDSQRGLQAESSLRVAAETRFKEAQANIEEQKQLVDDARRRLAETFNSLAADALKNNNQAFLNLAAQAFGTIQAQAQGDLEIRQKSIEAVVAPLKDGLERYEKQILEMEKTRQAAYGGLDEQLRNLAALNLQLQQETGSLTNALKGGPHVRGRWGELTLRRVAELAGMSEHCDFTEQARLAGESGRLIPDMIVNLAGGRRIVVDAKVPLQAFLDAASVTSEAERKTHLERHSKLVRTHMNQLGARAYWEQFDQSPEIVALFLPGEAFFSSAMVQDSTLIEDGLAKKIFLVTPITLIALLRAVAYGWRQKQIEQNAQEISDRGKELYDRIKTFVTHFEKVGTNLKQAIDAYNRAVASLESRVLPSVRKFKELGAATGDEIIEIAHIDEIPRPLAAQESEPAE